jgi:hypothetical protein
LKLAKALEQLKRFGVVTDGTGLKQRFQSIEPSRPAHPQCIQCLWMYLTLKSFTPLIWPALNGRMIHGAVQARAVQTLPLSFDSC